jgi:LSD1 subclass zinc finger protein
VESISCPKCDIVLRVPEGAAAVRCPQCQSTLRVEPPKAAPARPVVRKAVPVKPAKPKIRVVDEAAEAAEAEAKARAEKKKHLREAMDRLQEEKEEEREQRIAMKEYCRLGRKSLGLLYWGVRLYALMFLLSVVLTGVMILAPYLALYIGPLALVGCLASMACIGAGFGYAIAGPPAARHYGYIGLGVTILQALAVVGQFLMGSLSLMVRLMREGAEAVGVTGFVDVGVIPAYGVVGLSTNFYAVTDTPALLAAGIGAPWIGLLAGVLEFTRMIVLGLLVQHFAELGKATETGFRAFRVISVYFWIMLLAMMFRLALILFLIGAQPRKDDFIWWVIFVGYFAINASVFLTVLLQLVKLGDTIEDTREFVVADRYLAKSAPIDF